MLSYPSRFAALLTFAIVMSVVLARDDTQLPALVNLDERLREQESCWGADEDYVKEPSFLDLSPSFPTSPGNPASPGDAWGDLEKIFGKTIVWLFKMMPGMRAKLYGRSLTPPCRCEACAYTLDTLIMYLDEDTMGWYTPDDIQHIMMDRFCYGIKWLYRSACHHILSAYFDDIAAMAMGHMTGLDICRVLRFCPYYYSGGNMLFGNTFPFNIMGGSAGGSASAAAH